MTTTLEMAAAVVKYPALESRRYNHGLRINVVVDTGEEQVKLWGSPDSPLTKLEKGDAVTIAKSGNSWKLVEVNTPPIPQNPPTPALTLEPTPDPDPAPSAEYQEPTPATADLVDQYTNLMAACLRQAYGLLVKDPDHATLLTAASNADLLTVATTIMSYVAKRLD